MNKALFIDKDGTLIRNIPFNVNPELIELEEYADEGLYKLQENGFYIIIISNQPGIALGYFKEEDLKSVEDKIKTILSENKITLKGFYYCPHSNEGDCECRKPKPGLILKAAYDFQIDLSKSWMIGDILNDVEAGKSAGCNTILIDNGNETEWLYTKDRTPNYIVPNLKEAAEIILLHVE